MRLINIALALITSVLIYFFCSPVYWTDASIVVYVRLISVIVLILTKRNNLLAFFILLLIGLTVISFPTFDGFFILNLAVYMFISSILRLFKIKQHVLIGLTFSVILGLILFWDHTNALVSENKITFTKNINNEVHIELGDTTGKATTSFNFNQLISPRQKGLQIGEKYAYRVLDRSGNAVIPLDKWPVSITTRDSRIKLGKIMHWFNFKNIALHGTFNYSAWLPLKVGDYTIQLVKIENTKGIIVAESSFAITPYSKDVISNVTAYFIVEGDPNKYYDSYTRKVGDNVTVQVIAPKGVVISGVIKSYMTDLNGVFIENSWIGVSENTFTTGLDGEPISLHGMSGNPLPGIYNYEIIIDDKVVFHLKYICGV